MKALFEIILLLLKFGVEIWRSHKAKKESDASKIEEVYKRKIHALEQFSKKSGKKLSRMASMRAKRLRATLERLREGTNPSAGGEGIPPK